MSETLSDKISEAVVNPKTNDLEISLAKNNGAEDVEKAKTPFELVCANAGKDMKEDKTIVSTTIGIKDLSSAQKGDKKEGTVTVDAIKRTKYSNGDVEEEDIKIEMRPEEMKELNEQAEAGKAKNMAKDLAKDLMDKVTGAGAKGSDKAVHGVSSEVQNEETKDEGRW